MKKKKLKKMLKKLKKENKKDLDILERAIASRINQCRMRVDALQNNLDFERLRIDGLVERERDRKNEEDPKDGN